MGGRIGRVSRDDVVEAQAGLIAELPHLQVVTAASTCWACGDASKPVERAHLVAAAHGGGHEATNLVLLCAICHTEQPDGQPREVQLLWLKSHELLAARRQREALRIMALLGSIATQDELVRWFEQRKPPTPDQFRTASTRPHTLDSNATWSVVAEFLAWRQDSI